MSETLTTQAYLYAKWPVDAVAGQRGIRSSQASAPAISGEEKKGADIPSMTQERLREILDVATASLIALIDCPVRTFGNFCMTCNTALKNRRIK